MPFDKIISWLEKESDDKNKMGTSTLYLNGNNSLGMTSYVPSQKLSSNHNIGQMPYSRTYGKSVAFNANSVVSNSIGSQRSYNMSAPQVTPQPIPKSPMIIPPRSSNNLQGPHMRPYPFVPSAIKTGNLIK
jgi:hypothetical protein